MKSILCVNAGSTSLKVDLVDERDGSVRLDSIAAADPADVEAVAHRVVHGGTRFREPVVIDEAVHEQIRALEPLAPLHNAPALAAIDEARRRLPDVPHVAVFDTAFHATMSDSAATYALPRQWRARWGVRRFGFHGLSVAWSAERAPQVLGRSPDDLRLVVCHLGGGCSVTAVRAGRSVDTTMGFSPAGGVPMATRAGSLDPGVLVYVMREHGLDVDQVDRALNLESGLAGLAGTGDVLEIVQAASGGDADAQLALDVFAHRVAGAVAAMATAAGGLDALVFTAGIGEGSALVRQQVCERLRFLGVELDGERNGAAEPDSELGSADSAVSVVLVHAREEVVAARAARALCRS